MYADRYEPRRVNRGSLGLSIGIVGALLGATLLSSPTIRAHLPTHPLQTYWVPPPPPVPQPEPQPRPHQQARTIDLPIPQVPTDPKVPLAPTLQPPLTDPGTALGNDSGPATVIEPLKPPPPVLTGTEIDGRYARDFQPLYPPAEQRAGRTGAVVIRVLVGVDGRVRQADEVSATSDEFWRVTQRQALTRWRFKPATRDGIPVEAWRTMTVRFTLQDAGD